MWSVFHLVCFQHNTKKQVFEVTRYCKYASTLILKLFPTRFIKGYRWLCETHTVWKLKQYMYKMQTNEKIYCPFLADLCFLFLFFITHQLTSFQGLYQLSVLTRENGTSQVQHYAHCRQQHEKGYLEKNKTKRKQTKKKPIDYSTAGGKQKKIIIYTFKNFHPGIQLHG